ncbi:MAG: DUF305 domain-containing protein [Gemmatimonadales bacterium]
MALPRSQAVLLIMLAVPACIGAAQGVSPASPPSVAANQKDSAAIAKARADSARYPYTAADVHFMSAMIGHHAQAVVMSGWAPTHGASPSVRTLAERIINGQQDEMASMKQWLRDRGQTVPDSGTGAMSMPMHGAGHEMLMPGMLTEVQMKQLDQARGPEFDRLFLTFMIQHHRGAVTMVRDLFSSRGAGQDQTVFKFASDVSVDQSTEIERMERMLAALTPGKPAQ